MHTRVITSKSPAGYAPQADRNLDYGIVRNQLNEPRRKDERFAHAIYQSDEGNEAWHFVEPSPGDRGARFAAHVLLHVVITVLPKFHPKDKLTAAIQSPLFDVTNPTPSRSFIQSSRTILKVPLGGRF
jgi:hypothetical protein